MRRTGVMILGAVLLMASPVCVPLLAGCGASRATPDPLVGTWRPVTPSGTPGSPPLIITKAKEGYLATLVYWGPEQKPASPRPTMAIPLARHGDKLVGTYEVAGLGKVRLEIDYLPQSGRLTWANSKTPNGPLIKDPGMFAKVSGGTAYPTTP